MLVPLLLVAVALLAVLVTVLGVNVLRLQRAKRQQFGANWDRVQSIMATLRRYGIYLADVKPGNISFY